MGFGAKIRRRKT